MKLNIQLFASTKSTTFSESNISVTNNTSSLTIKIEFSANNSVTYFSSATLNCTCNGVSKSTTVSHPKGGKASASFTFSNIAHNSDGSKSVAWSWSCATGTSALGTQSASGTKALTKIARASAISFSSSSVELGQSVTINITRYLTGASDKLTYNINGSTGTIATTTANSYVWTPPIDLAEQIINSTTGTCVITCTTYNGSSSVGSNSKNLTLVVPDSVVPSVSIGTLTEADTTMISKNWGIFLQNKSKLNIPITASGIYNSTIQSIVTTINGLSFTGSSVVTSTLITAGTNTISTTVTDSRGRTATTTTTYSVVPYTNPNIQIAQAQRCLSDGTLSDDGTYLLIDYKADISSADNNNSKIHKIGYKRTTDSTYTYVTLSSSYSVDIQDQVSSFTISSDFAYDVIFEATDSFMTSPVERLIDTGFDLLNFNASGKAMAIGKVSEASANQELLEVNLPTEFLDDVETQSVTTNGDINATGDITATTGNFDILNVNGEDIIDTIKNYNVLWQGTPVYVIDTHTLVLSDLVSNQKNGIVLVWQAYSGGQVQDYYFNYTFIPKFHTAIHNGAGLVCWLSNSNGSSVATKYVYVSDNQITGNASNGTGRTQQSNSNIYTNNNSWVLTAVLGV